MLGAALVLVRFMHLPFVKRSVVVAREAIAVAVALVVMLYTGLLLQSVGGVAFGRRLWCPLFVLSSASSSIARLFAVSFFVECDQRLCPRTSRARLRGCGGYRARPFALHASLRLRAKRASGVQESFSILTQESGRTCVVARFGVCGIAAPLAEAVGIRGRVDLHGARCECGLVLIGAFCLRYGIVEAGVHRDLVLEPAMEDDRSDQV